jgi:hypothetical protein
LHPTVMLKLARSDCGEEALLIVNGRPVLKAGQQGN